MSSLTFKAVIGGVHVDPKKGIVKIQLEATSYVSLDELTTLGPQDESVKITLESEQTKIEEVLPGADGPVDGVLVIDDEGTEWLDKVAGELRDSPDGVAGEEQGDLGGDEDDDEEEAGGGQGEII
jgi:hypothetical protein